MNEDVDALASRIRELEDELSSVFRKLLCASFVKRQPLFMTQLHVTPAGDYNKFI